jgi:CBS domain-containing protein
MKISTILATKGYTVITARAVFTLKEAAVKLAEHKIGAMVVLDDDEHVVGIFSERDLVRAAASHDDALSLRVGDVMTRRVITGTPNDDVLSVIHTMTERRFRHLPIVDQGKLVGIVSIGDMVKAQLAEYRGEIETLETQITEG